jgi:hypothetical protein
MPTKAPKKAARREPRVVGARAKSRRTPARPKAAKTSAKTAAAKTASAKAAGAKAAAESTNHRRATWGLLVYLAGDIAYGADAIREDLREILKAGGSADLRIVVQHDGPAGASRYIVPSRSSPNLAPIELGRVDSGSTSSLLEFLRWGMSVCDCERLALVLGSPLVVSPVDAEGDPQPDRASVFSLSYDQGSGNYMDVSSVAGVIREALSDARREQIDLLAIDSCRVQFLELAYELEDIVRILIAPQTEAGTSSGCSDDGRSWPRARRRSARPTSPARCSTRSSSAIATVWKTSPSPPSTCSGWTMWRAPSTRCASAACKPSGKG